MTINRRQFMKLGMAGGAILGSTAAAALPIRHTKEAWDESHDVVIIGAGAAGLTAAVAATEKKLDVVVFEKEAMMGGSSVLCGGMIAVSETAEQKAAGIQDSDDLFVKDLMVSGGGFADEKLVRAYVASVKEHYQWLLAHGLKPDSVVQQGGQSAPRSHHFSPSKILMTLADAAKKQGAKIVTKAKAERLIWNEDVTRIVGVTVRVGDKVRRVEARKGVLLAAGGFSCDPVLLGRYNPPLAKAAVIAGRGTTGDGVRMGLSVGADMLDTSYIKATYGFKLNPISIDEQAQIYWSGAIIVNKNGKRFVDESISYKKISDYALAQPEGKSWIIFDQAILEKDYETNPQGRVLWEPVLKEGKSVDYLFSGKTIEEAAEKAGFDPKVIRAAVDRYNANVDAGSDPDCNRTQCNSGGGKLVKIEKAPFYVFPATGAMIATYCGLRIDEKTRVVDVWGDVIPGLYAAGEMTGGFHGAGYISGTAFAKAQAFGRIAGLTMAA